MCEQWQLHYTSQQGLVDAIEWACVLCGCHIKNDWASRAMNLHKILRLAWKFLHGNYQMIEATAMGNWWLAASSWHHAHSCITSGANFFLWNIKALGPTTAQIWHPVTSAFPQTKITPLKWTRFQTVDEIQDNKRGQLMVMGRTVWGAKVPTLKGTEVSLSYVQCFLYLVSSINVSIFHTTWLDTIWTDLCISLKANHMSTFKPNVEA